MSGARAHELAAWVDGLAVLGPGLADWPAAAAVLSAAAAYQPAPTLLPAPLLLPAAERRRCGRAVRLALAAGLEASARAGLDPAGLVAVFTSSGGDGDNCHEICEALATKERQLSPTRFHNSVHNAPAGYWSIATGAMAASTSLCAYDASFAAGLLEALAELAATRVPVLLVAYDTPNPEPLRAHRPIPDAFGVALVLAPQRSERSLARLGATLGDAAPDRLAAPALEALRAAVPAARSLPLLELLARRAAGRIALEYLAPASLAIGVEPC